MATVYKYFESKFKKSIVMGFLRLNTFSSIRQSEIKGHAINDESEGVTTNKSGNFDIPDVSDKKYAAKLKQLNQFLQTLTISGNTKVNFRGVVSKTILPDAYLFCTTQTRNDLYWREHDEIGYDACIEIYNYAEFCRRVFNAIGKTYHLGADLDYISKPCTYQKTEGNLEDGNILQADYFRKHTNYKTQEEVRLVIQPRDDAVISPKVAISPKTIWINPEGVYRLIKFS